MQNTNFVALTGHLNDYPLADLIGILRHRRKSGRLLIEYSLSPCSFYFVEGDLVDAQLNSLKGLQAVLVALSQPNAAFNFNPLIGPPGRSISESSQKVILELLGCWDEKAIDVAARIGNDQGAQPAMLARSVAPDAGPEMLPTARDVLSLPPSPLGERGSRRSRRLLLASAIISLLVSVVTIIAFTRWSIKREVSDAVREMAKSGRIDGMDESRSANAHTVRVRVEVERGRVARSFVEEHRPGLEAYETLALKIARQRRYAESANGQDTVLVQINEPR